MIEGYVHPEFGAVAKRFARQLRAQRVGGGGVAVYHRGELVVDIWGGDRNDAGEAWDRDTMSLSFSTSKGVTATAVHVLADQGKIDYDAPVAEYWPEFAANGKADITVRQLLSHEAGLHDIRYLIDDSAQMLDWDHMVTALAAAAPGWKPGTANGYHGITFGWLAGELVRRVGGKSVGAFVQAELAEPLGLDGLHIGVPPEHHERIAQLTRPFAPLVSLSHTHRVDHRLGKLNDAHAALLPQNFFDVFWNRDVIFHAEIPGANGVFTARSLAKLYAVLANGGSLDGVYLMSPETVLAASTVQNRRPDRVVSMPMMWRLGYHMAATTRGILPRGFGHFGYGGSGAWADPERNLSVALVVNRVAGTPFGDVRFLQIGAEAVACADARHR